jgi:hypothetical protein
MKSVIRDLFCMSVMALACTACTMDVSDAVSGEDEAVAASANELTSLAAG